MNRFEKIVEILDNAVAGRSVPVGFHGPFWRGVSRNEFVAKIIFGLPLIVVGDGAGSNLVKALRGETPFGADQGNDDADFNRMPSGLDPVAPADIAFIQSWIDDGCREDPIATVAPLTWRKTNAPVASSRTDDIWFTDPKTGWAVNSNGNILKTADGGDTWGVQHAAPGVYFRCVGFANPSVGWVGTLSRNQRLFHTTDGGQTWARIANLPTGAPVAICGISVVSDKVVFGSGTNRPTDFARIVKTLDGGETWTAIDMSAHASILIDTYFTDSLHGWVVGGKANAPTPTTRDKLKPVVLETADGGLTWINCLAGHEAEFPLGEWGWKIQFLNDRVGFVSLENFTQGAILKTTDGGKNWTRLKINDPQGTTNLEGVGFIDEQRGWVGGWGSADLSHPTGFSSVTTDGGANWANANAIGLRINRFRFLGNPVFVGYASGFTVYKYSSDPIPTDPNSFAAAPAVDRPLLPEAFVRASQLPIQVPLNVPAGTKRLTLHAWDRFGVDLGLVLDEIRPQYGNRVFSWDGIDDQGNSITSGDYILRLTADDTTASAILTYQPSSGSGPASRRKSVRRSPALVVSSRPQLTTLAELMEAPQHDLEWLKNALQIAVQLELSTLPPYLTARWTVKPQASPVAKSIREIRGEEMVHLALACNLLTAIGGTPILADASVIPSYPGPLPGGVRPGLIVTLRKLSREQAGVFMAIEYPDGEPLAFAAPAETFDSIGEFYKAILAAFTSLNPPLSVDRQLELDGGMIHFWKIDSLAKVTEAINLINLQGAGSNLTPEEAPGDPAHYYRFGEIFHGKSLIKDENGKWSFTGPDVPLPDVWDMADIPEGGYQQANVPDPAVWDLISRFDQTYSEMLRKIQDAWTHGDPAVLGEAVSAMLDLGQFGRQLIQKPKPDGSGNYGPCFRHVS